LLGGGSSSSEGFGQTEPFLLDLVCRDASMQHLILLPHVSSMGPFSRALSLIHQPQGRIQFHLPNEDADTRADINVYATGSSIYLLSAPVRAQSCFTLEPRYWRILVEYEIRPMAKVSSTSYDAACIAPSRYGRALRSGQRTGKDEPRGNSLTGGACIACSVVSTCDLNSTEVPMVLRGGPG
jgi:hypothetical protein